MSDGTRPPAVDESLWQIMAQQIGLPGLIVASAAGGGDGTFLDLAGAIEELGWALAPVPVLSTAGFAVPLLTTAGTPEADAVLRRIAGGGTVATVAWDAAVDARDGALWGTASFVLDGLSADVLVVPAGDVVWVVEAAGAGVERGPMRTLDLTRAMADVRLAGAPAVQAGPLRAAGRQLAQVALAAEQVGIARRCLEDAVAYAKVREQFGRPIGSFQSIKHKLVDLLLEVEVARAALEIGVGAAGAFLAGRDSEPGLPVAAAMAAAQCGECAAHVSREALHVFGGLGFTWEHDSHLFYRRAKTDEVLLGSPATNRAGLVKALGLAAG
jgi:alkylation response protein AidB-like acyl-CoA dehydrogenase